MVDDVALVELLVIASIWMVSMLGATVLVTTTYAVYSHRKHDQYDAVTERMQSTMFTRLDQDEPAWDQLAAGLSDTEREALQELLRDYLDMLKGPERTSLQQLGTELGIDEWAIERLETGYPHQRLLALDWLELLGIRVPPPLLYEKCIGEAELEAAGAHLLLTDDPAAARKPGTKLLLSDGTPLSIRGMDALSALYDLEPDLLLEYAEANASGWEPGLLAQVLEVLSMGSSVDPETSLQWVIDRLDHDAPRVRAAALLVLQEYEWRPDVRTAVDLERLTQDPSERVRRNAYHLVGAWGGEETIQTLQNAVTVEPNHRARLEGIRMLAKHVDRTTVALDPSLQRAWDWVEATAAIGNQ
ncbi:MAG: HEAT repeat domain-containing protein [Halobacteriales archaeon]|nr:HEAT repeat domain-containing protein [Halobacteriales archaeon]